MRVKTPSSTPRLTPDLKGALSDSGAAGGGSPSGSARLVTAAQPGEARPVAAVREGARPVAAAQHGQRDIMHPPLIIARCRHRTLEGRAASRRHVRSGLHPCPPPTD